MKTLSVETVSTIQLALEDKIDKIQEQLFQAKDSYKDDPERRKRRVGFLDNRLARTEAALKEIQEYFQPE